MCLLHVPLARRLVQRAGARRPRYRSDPTPLPRRCCVCLVSHELVRHAVAEARMWAHRIVMLPPTLDDDLCLGAEPFVAKIAVEGLSDAILPGLASFDHRSTSYTQRSNSVFDASSGPLSLCSKPGAPLAEQARQHFDDAWRTQTARCGSASA
jgi:hypothetical protein